MKSNNTIYMKRPASWPNDLGREATYLGNGKTGALVFGGAGKEKIVFNRNDLWHHADRNELPRLDGALKEMRDLIDAGDYLHANNVMYQKLLDAGYKSETGAPFSLGCLQIKFTTESLFSHYRRKLHMDKAECEITYSQKSREVVRKCFVSRRDDTFYYEYSANEPIEAIIYFDLYDDNTARFQGFKEEIGEGLSVFCKDNGIDFMVRTAWAEYGAKIRVYGTEVVTDGRSLKLCGTNFRIAVKCCSDKRSLSRLKAPEDFVYDEKLKAHLPLHRRLYNTVDLNFGQGKKSAMKISWKKPMKMWLALS